MDVLEKARVMYYHRQSIQDTQDPARQLGWTNLEAQQKRFEALCHFPQLDGKVVLDVGCGTGDLKVFLDERYRHVTYLGIDHLPEFVNRARQRFDGVANTFFMQADFITDGLPEVDYVFASGALSYQTNDMLFPYSILMKLYSRARRGVAFNLLDDSNFVSSDWLKAYNRNEVFQFSQNLASRAELITGYLPDDFTILMFK
ncbi:MAG: class I SAM-dependent methyltransferase [Bacteroidota bacterium]